MADKLIIEIFREKNAEEFTKALAAPDSRLETGSAAAMTAAVAMSLAARAAAACDQSGEKAQYIARNIETLRGYMVHLIDEDVKSRGPLRRAIKEGDARTIEAARQPAVCIDQEIINMMGQALELIARLAEICPKDSMHYVGEAAELALAAVRCARLYIVDMARYSSDETYKFVARRENELNINNCADQAEKIRAAIEKALTE